MNDVDFEKVLAQAASLLKEDFPNDWKTKLAEIIGLIGESCETAILFDRISNLQKLLDFLENGNLNLGKEVENCLKKADISGISLEEFQEIISARQTTIPNKELKSIEYKNLIEKKIQDEASNTSYIFAFLNILTIVLEFVCIYKALQELKTTDNVVKESRESLSEIGKKLQEVKKKLDKLLKLADHAIISELNTEEKKSYMYFLKRNSDDLREKIRNIRNQIDSVKLIVNERIERLGDLERNQYFAGGMNFVRGGLGVAKLLKVAKFSSPGAWFRLLLPAAQFVGGGMNFYIAGKSGYKMDKLRSLLKDASKLEEQLDEYDKSLKQVEEIIANPKKLNLPDHLRALIDDY